LSAAITPTVFRAPARPLLGREQGGRVGGMVKVGDKAPEIELLDQDGNAVSLSGLRGHKVLVYFYP
jgi:peroxiredoxin